MGETAPFFVCQKSPRRADLWYTGRKHGPVKEKSMQYKLLVSDFDNTLVPFGEPKPPPGGGESREKAAGRRG